MAKHGKRKILVVDDALEIREYLSAILGENYLVSEASDGAECIDRIYQDRPDLVLLDVVLPNIGGDEVCFNLKKNAATDQIPVVFISSLAQSEYEKEYGKVLANGYLRKPIDIEDLTKTVETFLS